MSSPPANINLLGEAVLRFLAFTFVVEKFGSGGASGGDDPEFIVIAALAIIVGILAAVFS